MGLPPTEASNARGTAGYVKCRCGRCKGSCKLSNFDAKRCQLSSVASLSHLTFSSTFAVMQRVARVYQRQLILVGYMCHRSPSRIKTDRQINDMNSVALPLTRRRTRQSRNTTSIAMVSSPLVDDICSINTRSSTNEPIVIAVSKIWYSKQVRIN